MLAIVAWLLALSDVTSAYPNTRMDLRYATRNNFAHRVLYDRARCALRRAPAERLRAVAADLAQDGFGLVVYDCYRPLSVQRTLWSLVHDERYVADPRKGSRHNRGAAIDVSLTDREGHALDLGSAYDEFGPRAHRDFSGLTPAQRDRRARLDRAMEAHGFVGLPTEWWHFDAIEWELYPVDDLPLSAIE